MKFLNAFFFDEVDLTLRETFPFYGLIIGPVVALALSLVVR